MGVQGLTRLLKEEGWLPADASCSKSLWRANVLSDEARISRLPSHSTLALDGNGLTYYLHHVAYSRYFDQITGGPSTCSSSKCSCRTKNLSQTQVTRLLPQFMPLTMLDEVTKEFVQSLERNNMKLVVYWDGEGRRMKAGTTSKRKEVRDTEWSNLRQFCTYGVVPHSSNALCRNDWLQNFPMTRLLIRQVQFTLRQFPTIFMIQCEEEADREVAKASADNENCYCVGMDSDYLLFPNIKYVLLNTLDASGSVVSGCVLKRGELAEQLDLPSEAAMVEFAILMGNDYVGNSK
jgi:5'-3' exonuclease